jgi:hypothetical protein
VDAPVADVIRNIIVTFHQRCRACRIAAAKAVICGRKQRDEKTADRTKPDFAIALEAEAVVEKQDVLAETTKCTHE